MRDEGLAAAVGVALMLDRELDEDMVGLWALPWHIRRALPTAPDRQVQEIAASILDALVGTDVAIGDVDEDSGVFLPWSTPDVAGRAMAAWRGLGRDPDIGEVAWLAREA